MKTTRSRIKIFLAAMLVFFTSVVCTSSYITPEILTATAGASLTPEIDPTIMVFIPSAVPSDTASPSLTPGPILSTPSGDVTLTAEPSATATHAPSLDPGNTLTYFTQPGDSLQNLAARFGVLPEEIVSNEDIQLQGFLKQGQLLVIPQRLVATSSEVQLMPDSEVVFSNSASDLDVETYVDVMGGKLSVYREYLGATGLTSGAQIVERVALENSINPRLLLSLLQYQSNWVFGQPTSLSQSEYPMGHFDHDDKDLFDQVVWAANQLAIGYYGWRDGSLTQLAFNDDTVVRLAPTLNAGTVALMYFFNQAYPDLERWQSILDPESGFVRLHNDMFGDPQARAASTEPLLPPDLTQPALSLPFLRGQDWSHTGGPHGAWERQGAQAALDFAPGSVEPGCVRSEMWVVAAAPGVIARIGKGVVVLDLDGDGNEHTGWSLLYLHLSDINNLKVGQWVDADTLLGHPSCEGGISTGTHVHVARKYNGEWLAADGPVPFNLGGWVAHAGDQPYLGELTRGDETITACSCSAYYTHIVRTDDDP